MQKKDSGSLMRERKTIFLGKRSFFEVFTAEKYRESMIVTWGFSESYQRKMLALYHKMTKSTRYQTKMVDPWNDRNQNILSIEFIQGFVLYGEVKHR